MLNATEGATSTTARRSLLVGVITCRARDGAAEVREDVVLTDQRSEPNGNTSLQARKPGGCQM